MVSLRSNVGLSPDAGAPRRHGSLAPRHRGSLMSEAAPAGDVGAWQVWVDTGGTFTDCLARAPEGDIRLVKVLSSAALRATVTARRGERRLALAGLDELRPGRLDGWTLSALAGESRVPLRAWDGAEVELAADAPAALN